MEYASWPSSTRRPFVGTHRLRIALTAALALAVMLSACGGASAPSEPAASLGLVATRTPTEQPTETPTLESTTPSAEASTEPDSGNGRPVTINLVLSATKTLSDGSYSASGPARLCGDGMIHMDGNLRAFNFEFPLDGDFEIIDITFFAADLVPGSTTTLFHIGAEVKSRVGNFDPPATVVQPGEPGSDDTGSAQLSESGGTTTLTVDGSDDVGQTIHMTATCGPRPG